MSLTLEAVRAPFSRASTVATPQSAEPPFQVIRRNGAVTPFDPTKITVALTKAFLAVEGNSAAESRRIHDAIEELTAQVVGTLTRRADTGRSFHIEDIQDQVELSLMRSGHHKVARAYVLYREERTKERAAAAPVIPQAPSLRMKTADGSLLPLDVSRLTTVIEEACAGLDAVDPALILSEAKRNLYDGISLDELELAPILATRTLIEREPNYTKASARLLMDKIRREALSFIAGAPDQATQREMSGRYPEYFLAYVKAGVAADRLDPELAQFDLPLLGAALKPERDLQFDYLGLQTLYDRYFLHVEGRRFELPQAFFMRVAMGLALREIDREAKAIEFYSLLSSFDFMASTPTLFNAGTQRRSFRPAFSPRCQTTSTASSNRSRTTRYWRNIPVGWATTGAGCGGLAPISRAPMASARAWCRS